MNNLIRNQGKIVQFFVFLLLLGGMNTVSAQDPDLQALAADIEKAVSDFEITGLTMAIVKDQEVIFVQSFGWSDREEDVKMKPEAVFNIASLTKAFTAAGIGLLVEEGKLSWDTRVVDLIPQFKLADPFITQNLNMEDILSHRSGLGTFYGDLLWYETDYSMREVTDRMKYLPIINDYRREYGYQNCMYILAGEIIETITGQEWSDFIREKFLQPLQMTRTVTSSSGLNDQFAIAYPHLDHKKTKYSFPAGNPAASIYSNVEDMTHWIMMLLNQGVWNNNPILESNTIDKLFHPHLFLEISGLYKEIGSRFRGYSLGWNTYDYGGCKIMEHGGGMPGYVSKIAIVPEENMGMVILTNSMSNLPTALMYHTLDLFLGVKTIDWTERLLEYESTSKEREEKVEKERIASRIHNTQPSLSLEEYVGVYTDTMYGDASIEFRNDTLMLTLEPTAELFTSDMVHWHYDTFMIRFKDPYLPEGFVTFSFDSNGQIKGFTIDLPNPDFHFFNLDFRKTSD